MKRLVADGETKLLLNSGNLSVRTPTPAPLQNIAENLGRYERLLGDETVRTSVPMLLRPWVMDGTHNEAIHLQKR